MKSADQAPWANQPCSKHNDSSNLLRPYLKMQIQKGLMNLINVANYTKYFTILHVVCTFSEFLRRFTNTHTDGTENGVLSLWVKM